MENIMIGFANVFQLSNLLVCIGGLFIGVLFGALPGFSAPWQWQSLYRLLMLWSRVLHFFF